MDPARRYDKGWKESQSFQSRTQYRAEQILGRSRTVMTKLFTLSKLQGDLMREAQEINEEARYLARIAQEESAAMKAKAGGLNPSRGGTGICRN